jgi:uncharacterized membrane protein (UPF0127 family)
MKKVLRKKERHVIFSVILIAALVALVIYTNQPVKEKVCIEDKACFNVEIAKTTQERANGLSNRASLPEDDGMLFVFPEPSLIGFWAKEMKFSFDIIWINENSEIIGFEKSLEPCESVETCPVYYPPKEIKYVLEINSGLSDNYSFEEGDVVYFIVP